MNNLEELKQEVAQILSTPDSFLGKAFQEAGITPENGEAMAAFMEQVGLTQEHFKDRQVMGEFLANLVQTLTPEMKGQFRDMVDRWSGELNPDAVPSDISVILSQLAGK